MASPSLTELCEAETAVDGGEAEGGEAAAVGLQGQLDHLGTQTQDSVHELDCLVSLMISRWLPTSCSCSKWRLTYALLYNAEDAWLLTSP